MITSSLPPTRRMGVHELTYAGLEKELAAAGLKPVHAAALWRSLYADLTPAAESTDFLPPLQRWTDEALRPVNAPLYPHLPPAVADIESSDGYTRKFLLKLGDEQTIETVLMGFRGRYTACLSTQAGCAMGCVFCATGQMGFVRHLTPGEIVAQVLHAQRSLRAKGEAGLRNLVFMGMGEPLHNYDAVMQALEVVSDRRGLNIGPSKITISTVGVVPGIERLAAEKRPYNLAVSLHGATEEARAALVPASKRWSLAMLIAACRDYVERTGKKIFFEWTLIEGKNDSPEQAAVLGKLLRGMHAHVNLIPLNPTSRFDGSASGSEAAAEFQKVLAEAGLPST
ncbi:MAG: 23S rRNA (adenine(2503)-C(2))-methyltransferase RlmN, partial [Chthoniobacteraceae bacterium]